MTEENQITELDIDNDVIIRQWLKYCAIEPKDSADRFKWVKEKEDFWKANKTQLLSKGFDYDRSITSALDYVETEKVNGLEGCLLLVKLGSDKEPARPEDVEVAYNMISQSLKGVKGIRVIVAHHLFNIEKIPLPQLRHLQSEVLASCQPDDNGDTILKLEL